MLPVMATTLRKQREVERRHALILDHARRMLLERGYLGLTMDRLAAATEYSKGTLYEHFSCKEEVVIALVIETAGVRAGLFERAARFEGRPRERMVAIGEAIEVFVHLHPDHFKSEQVIRAASVRDKTSPARQADLARCELRCMSAATGIVRDAVAAGDLTLPADMTPEELTFGLWATSCGVFSIVAGGFDLALLGVPDPIATYHRTIDRLLDGLGWQPLASDWDFDAVQARVRAEVFPDEWARLAGGPALPAALAAPPAAGARTARAGRGS